ncbi:MAG: tripartite tricarboxylate transporter substrate binding protein [Burkholderiales bacterium]|nr:tripartite tricarboxylate transporter substrate binding protein [Burkholderiales bacterium]
MKRRQFIGANLGVLGMLSAGVVLPISAEEAYPARTVEVINQFGPGGGTDNFIKAIGRPFYKITKRTLVGISVQGGGGVPAAQTFFSRPADGYTMMAIGPEEMINDALGRIDSSLFRPVARIQYDQGLFYALGKGKFKSIQDVITAAKANPEEIKIAVTGAAGFDQVVVGLWNLASGGKITPVPFGSAAESIAAVLGGHVDLLYEEYGPARGMIESGDLRPLVIFTEKRLPVLPAVPTALELGYDVTLGRWRGFALKKADSEAHAKKLYDILAEASKAPEYKAVEEKSALQYRSVLFGPDEFATFLNEQRLLYKKMVKELGYTK